MADVVKITRLATGKEVEVKVQNSTINAMDLKSLGLAVYDSGYVNTASCKSKITFIDGDKGWCAWSLYAVNTGNGDTHV